MSRSGSHEHRAGRALNRLRGYFWPTPCSALGRAVAATVVAPGGPMRRVAHVRQYEHWSLLFMSDYRGSRPRQWMRGRAPYRGNRFERQARLLARAAGASAEAGKHG
jgi:hypothetical protein